MAPVKTRGNSQRYSAENSETVSVKNSRKSKRREEPLPPLKIAKTEASTPLIESKYNIGDLLGSGGFAEVFKGLNRNTNDAVAIKKIQRRQLSPKEEKRVYTEVEILRKLYHPNIMRLKDFYEEDNFFYLVLEYIGGGELFNRISLKRHYNENEARDVMKTILYAVKHCHERNIVHRDLKPENLVLLHPDDDSSLKVIDFGLAVETKSDNIVELVGTPQFLAPEIISRQPYGKDSR